MASIQSSLQLFDGMTPVIRSITNSVNLMLSTFNTVEGSTNAAFDTAFMVGVQEQIAKASASLIQYQEQLKRAQQAKVQEPTWKPIQAPEVFMNTGVERFQAELQAANQAASRLASTQQTLTTQAAQMQIIPRGMTADVTAINSKVQELATRIQALSSIPPSQMTDQTNAQLEAMRGKLSQIMGVQENLNTSMTKMDISATNAAYQQLNNLVNSVNQGMRDNFQPPPAVTWQTAQAPEVFMNTGAERFQAELQAANQAASQLVQRQQSITATASQMRIIPPGMLNDISIVGNKVQSLATRIKQLESIPVNLRTDRVNSQLESMRGQLGNITGIQNQLNNAMSRMDISAANAAYQQLNSALDVANRGIRDNFSAQEQFNRSVQNGQSAVGKLGSRIQSMVRMYLGIRGIRMAVNFVSDTTSLQNVQNEAETKLAAIMQQRMGANPTEIQSIKDLTAAQQGLGVVGDEVQLSGAQQLATFLNTGDALSTLIPAMNNLAVQQNGVNVSTEDMTNIGNMMGKVMQGNVGALTRVGVTFTEAQEKVLKYGNEQERAATLAQVITDNVSNMNAIMAATPQGQIQQVANAWGDIKEQVGAKLYPALMKFFTTINQNMPTAESLVMGLAEGINVVMTVIGWLISGVSAVASFFQDNWSIIEPIIWGIVAALVVYNAVMGIGWLTSLKDIGTKILLAGASTKAAIATFAQTAAQQGLNVALAACPITWLIVGLIAIIAVIYAVVAAFNKFTGASISATGIVAGAFSVLGAMLINTFLIPLWNLFAEIANFFGNVFHDPVAAVKMLFLGLAETVIGYITNMAQAIEDVINKIPGVEVNITSGLDHFQDKIKSATEKVKSESEWVEYVKKKDFIDLGDAANAGYKFGEGLAKKGKSLFEFPEIPGYDPASFGNSMDGVFENTGATAGNTAAMADNMELLDEDLKYMREAAEQEVINRFTLAELKIDVSNNNTLTTKTDFDDLYRVMTEATDEILHVAAEGA